MKTPELHLVSILSWPAGWARQEVVRTLVESIGLDPADAHLHAVNRPPMVAGLLDPAVAADAVRVLRAKSVPALDLAPSQFDALRPPLLAKRLVPAVGAPEPLYMVEPWRGEPRGLRMRDVVLIVRGRITKYTRTTTVDVEPQFNTYSGRLSGISTEVSSVTETMGGREDALDLYTREGPPVRITGRFDFTGFLGAERGYSDGENMDRLALRLGQQAPHAEIDLAFREFKPPPGIGRVLTVSLSGANTSIAKRDDTPLFDFYSAWKALICLKVLEWQDRTPRRGAP